MADDSRAATQFDELEHGLVVPAMHAVAKNIRYLTEDQRLRVLQAVAVLYGIIKPTEPTAPPPVVRRPPDRGSGRDRLLRRLEENDEPVTAIELAKVLGGSVDTIRSLLSKLSATGEIVRMGHGLYRIATPSPSEEKKT